MRSSTKRKEEEKASSHAVSSTQTPGAAKERSADGVTWLRRVREDAGCVGAVDHFASACTRPREGKGTGDGKRGWGKGEGKSVQKAEAESPPKNGGGEASVRDGESVKSEESGEVMKNLLEEANRMLRGIQDSKGEEGSEKEARIQKLQRLPV